MLPVAPSKYWVLTFKPVRLWALMFPGTPEVRISTPANMLAVRVGSASTTIEAPASSLFVKVVNFSTMEKGLAILFGTVKECDPADSNSVDNRFCAASVDVGKATPVALLTDGACGSLAKPRSLMLPPHVVLPIKPVLYTIGSAVVT